MTLTPNLSQSVKGLAPKAQEDRDLGQRPGDLHQSANVSPQQESRRWGEKERPHRCVYTHIDIPIYLSISFYIYIILHLINISLSSKPSGSRSTGNETNISQRSAMAKINTEVKKSDEIGMFSHHLKSESLYGASSERFGATK